MKYVHSIPLALAVLSLAGSLCLAGGVSAAGEKFHLVVKAKVGEVARYRSEDSLKVEGAGMPVSFETKDVEKITFTQVAANGNVTMERDTESSDATVNGQKIPSPDTGQHKETVVVRPSGALVSYQIESGAKEEAKLSARLYGAGNPLFPDTEVGVGDHWSIDQKADPDLGVEASTSNCELQGLEKVGGVDTAKVKMTYHETSAMPPISSTGTFWVERTSGDVVQLDMQIENAPFGDASGKIRASGKMHQERISGGPLGGPVGADGKPIAAKEKTIDDVVKDYEKQPGLFTLFRKTENQHETIYLELRQDQLGKLFLLQGTASTGTADAIIAGDPLEDTVFKFQEIPGDRLLMVTPNIDFRAAPNSPIARSVERSFPAGYLESFKIEARQPSRKSLLINISDFFRNDIAQVGQQLSGGGGGGIPGLMVGKSYSLDREKTYLVTLKTLPDNLFAQTAYHFAGSGSAGGLAALLGKSTLADPRSIPIKVDFNLFPLDTTEYHPRIADPRVGYFYTEYQDFTDDSKETQMVRYILRWNLEKSDPNAALSPPKKPIVFWLDNAIPTEYRDAVRDGILMWNKGFEKIGFKDAIVVKQMPDNADWDTADMRYNTIRWSTTQTPPYGAVALFRENPITGEMVNASITVDAALVRGMKLERKQLVDPSAVFRTDAAPKAFRPFRCDLAEEAEQQAWFGDMALNLLAPSGTKVDEKAYTDTFLRSVVCHEMGHVLGLFHNFAASTQLSLEQLKDPKKVKEAGITASVMDYLPFNISALKQKGVDYWTPTIGTYDYWAIEYGYSSIPAVTPEDELPRLKAIASQCNQPGHAYQNDFLADQFDPNVSRFDLSSDPLGYWSRVMQVSRQMLLTLRTRLPKHGESYWDFTRIFNGILNQYSMAAAEASRYIGGLHVNQNFRGDPGEKPTLIPVEGAKQREALELLNTYMFSETALTFPPDYYTRFTTDPFPNMSAMIRVGSPADFPVKNELSGIQRGALKGIFTAAVLNRVANNEFKSGAKANELTLPEMFQSTSRAIWSELGTHKDVPTLRRELQRVHLDLLITMALGQNGMPDDARMLAWDQLRQLKTRITNAKRPGVDEYTRVHFDESLMRINRTLSATQTISGAASRSPSILQLLLGEDQAPAAKP